MLNIIFLFLFSCANVVAPIIDHRKEVYNKKNYKENKNNHYVVKDLVENSSQEKSGKASEIVDGDTLYSLSAKHKTPMRDIIEANNLAPPYILKKGQKIIIPNNIYYEIKIGDTLYGVSRATNLDRETIITLNHLQEPFRLIPGEKLKITNVNDGKIETKKQEIAVVEKKPQEIILAKSSSDFYFPINGRIISQFGPKKGGLYNDGINIAGKEGEDIKTSAPGLVAYVGNELKGYGNLIIIKHSGGWITAYGHLSKTSVLRGENVKKSQIIGKVGKTGNVSSSQLYFGLRKGRDAVNPENYLKK